MSTSTTLSQTHRHSGKSRNPSPLLPSPLHTPRHSGASRNPSPLLPSPLTGEGQDGGAPLTQQHPTPLTLSPSKGWACHHTRQHPPPLTLSLSKGRAAPSPSSLYTPRHSGASRNPSPPPLTLTIPHHPLTLSLSKGPAAHPLLLPRKREPTPPAKAVDDSN